MENTIVKWYKTEVINICKPIIAAKYVQQILIDLGANNNSNKNVISHLTLHLQ